MAKQCPLRILMGWVGGISCGGECRDGGQAGEGEDEPAPRGGGGGEEPPRRRSRRGQRSLLLLRPRRHGAWVKMPIPRHPVIPSHPLPAIPSHPLPVPVAPGTPDPDPSNHATPDGDPATPAPNHFPCNLVCILWQACPILHVQCAKSSNGPACSKTTHAIVMRRRGESIIYVPLSA